METHCGVYLVWLLAELRFFQTQSASLRIYVNEFMTGFAPLHLVPQPQKAILRVSPTRFREVWGACPGRVGALGSCRGGGSAGFFCGVLVSVCLPLPRLLWYRCLDSSAGRAPDSLWSHL